MNSDKKPANTHPLFVMNKPDRSALEVSSALTESNKVESVKVNPITSEGDLVPVDKEIATGPKKERGLEDYVGELEGIPNGSEGSSMYMYRDFSNVAEGELEEVPASTTPPSRAGVETSIRVQKFPVKLYAILAQKEFNEVITWQPHGRAWKVLKPQAFESLVMPLFFEYSNYHSFNRLVNAWSFRRISSGPDRGSYYHEVRYEGQRIIEAQCFLFLTVL